MAKTKRTHFQCGSHIKQMVTHVTDISGVAVTKQKRVLCAVAAQQSEKMLERAEKNNTTKNALPLSLDVKRSDGLAFGGWDFETAEIGGRVGADLHRARVGQPHGLHLLPAVELVHRRRWEEYESTCDNITTPATCQTSEAAQQAAQFGTHGGRCTRHKRLWCACLQSIEKLGLSLCYIMSYYVAFRLKRKSVNKPQTLDTLQLQHR
jgi:hypothetical protein